MEEKKCNTCYQIKKINQFQTIKNYKTQKKYKRNVCKECRAKYLKNYYINNYIDISHRSKLYNYKNSESLKKYRSLYYKKNKERINKQKKLNYIVNIVKIKERQRIYYLNNKEIISKKSSLYIKNKLKDDKLFYLKHRISHRIRQSLKSKKILKNNRTLEILGCNPLLFKKHLENQFKVDMSWENRSKWHIDHIIPIKAANTEFEVIALNHYTNLQVLLAKDNFTKGDLYNKKDFDNYINWYVKNVRTKEEYNSLTL